MVGSRSGCAWTTAWNGSAWRVPSVAPPDAARLVASATSWRRVVRDPGRLPATQFYYVSTALPALVDRRAIAALLALPVPLLTPFVVIGLAIAPWVKQQVERRDGRQPQAPEVSTWSEQRRWSRIVRTFPGLMTEVVQIAPGCTVPAMAGPISGAKTSSISGGP